MKTTKILICEDDRVARELLEEILRRENYEVVAFANGEDVVQYIDKHTAPDIDLAISDVRLGDGMGGMELLSLFQERWPTLPVLLITAFGDVTGAMAAIKKGAYDYVSKPFHVAELTTTVRGALERTRVLEENRRRQTPAGVPTASETIVGRSAAMLEVYKRVARVAPTLSTVLVTGESGTGKELVARAIHTQSPRGAAGAPFVAVNCTALSESLLESELFGHAKGAFTGAVANRRGLFEEAQGGTLFLDEIGDVGPKMQAQLLRVLQEGEIRRVGGTESIRVDVRVVAATNKNLEAEVKAGRFREDLYFRIHVVTVHLPPLRERPQDVPLLVNHFLAKYVAREKHHSANISSDAMRALEQHAWPGNVRELENIVERALSLSKDGVILLADLPVQITGEAKPVHSEGLIGDRPTLAELEKRYIEFILRETQGNKKRAAEILGIDRRTLYRSLERDERPALEKKPDDSESN